MIQCNILVFSSVSSYKWRISERIIGNIWHKTILLRLHWFLINIAIIIIAIMIIFVIITFSWWSSLYVKVCSVCMVRSIRLPITGIGKHNRSPASFNWKTWGGRCCKDTQTHRHIHKLTNTDTQTYIQTPDTQTYIQTQTHRHIQKHRHTDLKCYTLREGLLFSGIARITSQPLPPPHPNFGHFFFSTYYRTK